MGPLLLVPVLLLGLAVSAPAGGKGSSNKGGNSKNGGGGGGGGGGGVNIGPLLNMANGLLGAGRQQIQGGQQHMNALNSSRFGAEGRGGGLGGGRLRPAPKPIDAPEEQAPLASQAPGEAETDEEKDEEEEDAKSPAKREASSGGGTRAPRLFLIDPSNGSSSALIGTGSSSFARPGAAGGNGASANGTPSAGGVASAPAAGPGAGGPIEPRERGIDAAASVAPIEAPPAKAGPSQGDAGERARGLVRFAKGRLDQNDKAETERAVAALSEAVALAPDSSGAEGLRATALNKLGRYAEAEQAARRAIELDPRNGAAHENLAWALLRQRKPKEAVDAADRLLAVKPDSALGLATRAYAKQLLGNRAGMLADIEAAAKLDSRFAAKAEIARKGGKIYDPEADDAGYLLGDAAAVPGGRLAIPILPLAGFGGLIGVGAALAWAWRRRPAPGFARARGWKSKPDLLGGRYKLAEVVGRGGMGDVLKAEDVSLGRLVAIKRLGAQSVESAAARERLRREAQSVAAVGHPSVVAIYEILEDAGSLYLVFEYLDGKTVHQLLAERGRLDPATSAYILAPVCAALEHAHQKGLTHRDLKPANIMVTQAGHVKLMDFGIARSLDDAAPAPEPAAPAGASPLLCARTTTIVGTSAYMSPEADKGVVSPAGDIFGLGVCLYEMLTGRRPFEDHVRAADRAPEFTPAGRLVPGLPAALDRLIADCLSPDPAARPANAAAFARRLGEALAPAPAAAKN